MRLYIQLTLLKTSQPFNCMLQMAATILNSSSHGFENDCKEIHDSRETLHNLAQALASRTQLERRQIRETYKAMYGEDLTSHLQDMRRHTNEAEARAAAGILPSPKTLAALSMWMLNPHERDAVVAREALEQVAAGGGFITNYMALVEILVGRKSSHVLIIKQAYQTRFRRRLDQDLIKIEPPNPFQKILVALDTSHKAHHVDISQHTAKCDARRLYETGEGKLGAIEEAVVLEIFSKRSIPQLNLTFSSYNHIYGHEYTKSLKKENSGEFEDALKMVVKCMSNPAKYYAKLLNASMKGRKKDKGVIARVMVSRAEVDMDEIQSVFKMKYGMELRDAIIQSTPSGDYRDFLAALATKRASS